MPEDKADQTTTGEGGSDLLDLAVPVAQSWKLLVFGPMVAAALALAASFLIPTTYLSRTMFLPPQQQQSSAVAALSQLGALSGLLGAGGIKTQADQHVALLQSTTVADRLIDRFKLIEVYDVDYRFQARKELARNTRITLGRKDGLITVEVEDTSAQRAADMANRYVEELRLLASQLALTEAQQRRVFFEAQLAQTRDRLTLAQQALQASGFSQGALKADAKTSAEAYARLRAEAIATEVRLQAVRRNLTDTAPEVQQALSTLNALRIELARIEEPAAPAGGPDYIGKFREFKYQEALFELFARQYELARLDESREGVPVQVVDVATPAERKHWPKHLLIAAAGAVAGCLLLVLFVFARNAWRRTASDPGNSSKLISLRRALGRT